VSEGYKDVTDLSVYVSFPITSGKYEGVKMLAWTTTPWTLPGNVLAAVGEKVEYVVIEKEGEKFIVAKELQEELDGLKELEVQEILKGSDLIGATYEPLFPFFKDHANGFRVVVADFVTTEEGTGIVHIAPGFGEDDRVLGKAENVEPIMHVEMNGKFVKEVAAPMQADGYEVLDRPVKTAEDNQGVDIQVLKWLAHNGKLFAKKKLVHSYPHCWRCDTPLLNYAISGWFVAVSKILPRLIESAKGINWVPEHIKEGRFGKGLEGSPDWSISRSRFWGTPLPVWRAEDGDIIVVGSVAELEDLTGAKVDDLHKHHIDPLMIEKNGKVYTRIPEVLDCWMESGSMPYAQLHYPFENKEVFDAGFPAEFIAEGVDQTRLWFHKLHVISNILFDMPAFKHVVVNGIVLAEDGKKMSKRLKNYPDPMEVMEKYGSDAVRYYLMSSPVVRAENLRFSEKEVAEVAGKFVRILNNVVAFYDQYAEESKVESQKSESSHVLDVWILARLNETLKEETEAMEAYDLQGAARPLQHFVTDLSTWYVRRSRDRFKALTQEGADHTDARAALTTLRTVLDTFSKMIAPFMPMLAEVVYQSVNGGFLGKEERLSVHLEMWPEAREVDASVLQKMGEARAIVSRVLEAREEAGRAIKQPLGTMKITVPSGEVDEDILQVILGEVNVKLADVAKGDLAVDLDTDLTPELIREGMVRDVSRRVNQLRKEAGLTIEDRIELKIWSASDEVRQMLAEHEDTLLEGTLSTSITFDKGDAKHEGEFRTAEQDVWIGF